MNNHREINLFTLSQVYGENIQSSRQTMNQMLTIIREQDRAMRDSIRDVERILNRNSPTLNSYVPAAPQQNSGMQSQTASENTYTIPYAPPRPPPPSWRPNLSPLRRPVYPDPSPLDDITNHMYQTSLHQIPTSQPMNHHESHRHYSVAERLNRYRESAARNDPSHWAQLREMSDRRNFLHRYTNLANLSPVRVRPTLREMAIATREALYGEIDDAINTVCPITCEPFNARDRVIQIRQCRHVFAADSIRQWFESNVRCPVCRHDIRTIQDISNNDATNSHNTQTNTSSFQSRHRSQLHNIRSNILDSSGSILQRILTDTSGNDNASSSNNASPRESESPRESASTATLHNIPSSNNATEIIITSTTDDNNNTSLSAFNDSRSLSTIVADQLRGTTEETTVAAESIMDYITNDIGNRLRENRDISGDIMIEYGFIVPNGATEPTTTNIQIRDFTTNQTD